MINKKLLKRILAGILAAAMVSPYFPQIAYAYNKNKVTTASQNLEVESKDASYMSKEEYASFGFKNLIPVNDYVDEELNPLEGYQPAILNELYIGHLNHPDDYQGYFATSENLKSIEASAMDLNAMQNDNLGGRIKYYDYKKMQTQCINAVALTPGNMNDEAALLNKQILIEARLYQDTDGADSSEFRVQAYSMVNGVWTEGEAVHECLDSTDDWVGDITVREQGGYNSMTTGDFDGDGYNEVAVFNPYGADSTGVIHIYQPIIQGNGTYNLKPEADYFISELGDDYKYASGTQRPLVNLTTTDMSGKDEIVLSVSYTFSTAEDACKPGMVAVLSYKDSDYVRTWWKNMKVSDSEIFRMQSAVPADLNMDGQDEIVIAGHRNYDFEYGRSRGSWDWENMYINVLLHDGKDYYLAWDESESQKVPMHPDLYLDDSEIDPVSLTAGKYFPGAANEVVFCEGAFYHFVQGEGNGNDQIINGNFTYNPAENLKFSNTDEAFVGTLATGFFVEDQRIVEQTVVVHGHNARSDDECDINITWFYGGTSEDGAEIIKQKESNNDYINDANEDDNGTCVVLAAVNVDEDSAYIKYKSRYYGYSNPEVVSVLLSQPYWEELSYKNGTGNSSVKLTYTEGTGTTLDWSAGLDFNVNIVGKAEFLGNGGQMGFDGSLAANYIGSRTLSNSTTKSKTFYSYGEDMAVVTVVPIVSYWYDLIYPLSGETEEFTVNTSYTPAFAIVTVDEYNKDAKTYNSKLSEGDKKLTEIDLADVFYAGYETGDPSSYPGTVSEINGIEDNNYEISDNVSLDIGSSGAMELGISKEESKSETNGFGVSLAIGAMEQGSVGIDIGVAELSSTTTLTQHLTGSCGLAWAQTNSSGMNYGGMVMNLPDSAQTGTSMDGSATSDYAFSTRLVQWDHTQSVLAETENGKEVIEHKIPYVGYVTTTTFTPPYRVSDLYVEYTTKRTAMLKWTKPKDRKTAEETVSVDSYELYMSTSEDGSYELIKELDGDVTSFAVNNLTPSTTYYFKMISVSANGERKVSNFSTIASGTTKDSGAPFIEKHPESIDVETDEKPVFEITARPYEETSTLSYQWQMMDGDSWKNIEGATDSVYNPAYDKNNNPEGTVFPPVLDTWEDAEALCAKYDNTIYRCVVTENYEDGEKRSVESLEATLRICDSRLNDNIKRKKMDLTMSVWDDSKTVGEAVLMNINAENANDLQNNAMLYVMEAHTGEMAQGYPKEEKLTNGQASVIEKNLQAGLYYIWATNPGNSNVIPALSNVDELRIVQGIGINYELNGGVNHSENPEKVSSESAEFQLSDPVKEGSTFEGWYFDAQFEHPLPGEDKNELHPADISGDNVTIYAKWQENSYTVNYELNGGTNGNNPSQIGLYDNITLADATKSGYDFEGWYADAEYTIPVTSVSGNDKQDITLYAKWSEAIEYRIQYIVGNGTNAKTNPSVYTIESEEIVFADAVCEGYSFTGWYADSEMTTKVTSVPKGSTGDLTVYAGWKFDEILKPNADGNYEIDSYEDLVAAALSLQNLPEKYAKATFVQTGNINCEMKEWSRAIGNRQTPFEGIYEGNGYYILGLRPTKNAPGIFGVIGTEGTVRDLSVVDMDYSGNGTYAGGIAGINYGTIDGCGSGVNLSSSAMIFRKGQTEAVPISTLDSDIMATHIAGGIVAINEGKIINCRNNSEVSMTRVDEESKSENEDKVSLHMSFAGGIAGINNGIIMNVYQNGEIKDATYAGGIAGENTGYIQYGYNSSKVTGKVAGAIVGRTENTDVLNMFYEDLVKEPSGNMDEVSIQATKMTAEEMKTQEFADMLNDLVKGGKLLTWEYNKTKNAGYPKFGTEKAEENLMISINRGQVGTLVEDAEEPDAGDESEDDNSGKDQSTGNEPGNTGGTNKPGIDTGDHSPTGLAILMLLVSSLVIIVMKKKKYK